LSCGELIADLVIGKLEISCFL